MHTCNGAHASRYTHIHTHNSPHIASIMSILRLCRLMYSRKLKSPLDLESTELLAARVITQPLSDAVLAAGLWFAAPQRELIWEYCCRHGSLWPCCQQAVWMSQCLEGTTVIEEWRWVRKHTSLHGRGKWPSWQNTELGDKLNIYDPSKVVFQYCIDLFLWLALQQRIHKHPLYSVAGHA